MYLVVEVEMVAAAAVVPVCAPAKKTMTGFSPKTHRLTQFVQYYLWCTIAALPLRQVNETLDQ